MDIYGIQMLTLLDFPGRVGCTIFLSGCNFRCPYCHNKALAMGETRPIMTMDNFMEWLNGKKGKIDGVCISGGEPFCSYLELVEAIWKIKSAGFKVKIDTNGSFPDELGYILYEMTPDYVAMDIKECLDKYETVARSEIDESDILRSINIIKYSYIEHEFRTTVTNSVFEDDDFRAIGKLVRGEKCYFLQKSTIDPPKDEDLERYKSILEEYVEEVKIR